MSPSLSRDAARFREWQLDALNARPAAAELKAVGPFRLVIPSAPDEEPWVTLTEPETTRAELEKAAREIRSILARPKHWEIEYNEAVLPHIEPWLVACGFELKERNPLMACRPQSFRPFAAPNVELTRLDASSRRSELEAFQHIRWTDGGEHDRPVPPVARLQAQLSDAGSVFLLAWIDKEPAGTGVSHPLERAAEIVGVVTRTDRRRRGVAATITSELVGRHFASGGDFVFLDASGEDAARVYERLGFTRFGANLVFS